MTKKPWIAPKVRLIPATALALGAGAVLLQDIKAVFVPFTGHVVAPDMTTTASSSDTGSFHRGGMVFSAASILEPQPPRRVSGVQFFIAKDTGDESDTGDT